MLATHLHEGRFFQQTAGHSEGAARRKAAALGLVVGAGDRAFDGRQALAVDLDANLAVGLAPGVDHAHALDALADVDYPSERYEVVAVDDRSSDDTWAVMTEAGELGLMGLSAQAQQALPAGYKAEYRMSTVVGTAFPWGKGGEIWANLVRERTQGRINIKMYPGVSLINGDQTREFTAIRRLHEDFSGECGRHCAAIIEARERRAPSAEVAELERFCVEAMKTHFRRVAALMPPAQGERYLAFVLPRVESHPHHGAPSLRVGP